MSIQRIVRFVGQHEFLSNFYEHRPGLTVEHLFQAMKTENPFKALEIFHAPTPHVAKQLGKSCRLRPDWEEIKVDVMRDCLYWKFSNRDLANRLLLTGDAELIEGNTWGDRFWGQHPVGVGENMLGKLLMEVRSTFQRARMPAPKE